MRRASPGPGDLQAMRLLFFCLIATSAVAQPSEGLACVADALGGAGRFDALRQLTLDMLTEADVDGVTTRTRAQLAVAFPGEARWTVTLADGEQTTTVSEGRVVVAEDEVETELMDEPAHLVRQSLWLTLPVLLARRTEVAVDGTCDDGLLLVAAPELPEPLVLNLDADGRPSLLSTFRERGGQREYLSVQYADYRHVDGLWLPFRVTQAVGGELTGDTRVERARLRVDAP